ncbi:MAG: hypothetical protein IKD21_05050 [Clostridia bacterium]|nr:hypothetical protein [Clostridia bacterium]
MTKKIMTIALILLLSACCVVSGVFLLDAPIADSGEPEATLPPGITKPEGRIISTNPKIVEGKITKLTEKKMCISVQNVEWELQLDETSRNIVNRLNELGVEIKKGTFVNVHYKEENGNRIATNVMRVESN